MDKLTTEQIKALPFRKRLDYINFAVIAAKRAAEREIACMDDGGTCNFDAAVLPVGKGEIFPQATSAVRLWARSHCAHFLDAGARGRGFHFHGGYQAATRTQWAERFKEVMEEHGVPMRIWYQMD